MIWFTADWHLWHNKVLELSKRPMPSVEDMVNLFQERINFCVGPKDTLVICGDVAFGPWERLAQWLDGLKCKHLILAFGNHDETVKDLIKRQPHRFERTGDIVEVKFDHTLVVCCHYAMRTWRKSCHGSYHVHGHSHGALPDEGRRCMDVGVDTNHQYGPWSWDEVIEKLKDRPFNPHH